MAELNTLSIGNRWLELAKTSLVSDANLQGYWRLESDGTDSSGNGYTLSPGTAPTYTTGKFGNGADFETTSSQYITRSEAGLRFNGAKTISCWIKPESLYGDQYFVGLWNSSPNNYYQLKIDSSGGLTFQVGGVSGAVTSDAKVSIGSWYHVAGSWDGTTYSVYVNGTKKSGASGGSELSQDAGGFSIGRTGDYAGGYFDGIIDDVAVFDRALTDAEILTLCDVTRKAYYRFESGARTTDSSGNGNTLTEDTAPDYVTGVYGDGAEYDGTSNDCMYDSSLTFTPFKNGGTFSGWIYVNSVGEGAANDYGRIFNGGAVLYMSAASGTNYKIRLSQQFGTTSGRWETDGYVIPQNTWTHVAVTYNNQSTSNDPTIYINGSSTAITEIATPAGSVVDNTTMFFGNNTNASGVRAFDGVQDDYCFFSRVLTAAEIREIYAGGGGAFLYNFV